MSQLAFAEKPFDELTKVDIKGMVRNSSYRKRIFPKDFCEHYGIDYKQYWSMIKEHDFKPSRYDRSYFKSEKEKEEKEKGKIKYDFVESRRKIHTFTVCALYNIPIEVRDNAYYYDTELYQQALEDIDNKIRAYERKVFERTEVIEYSDLKPIDLYALRVFRETNRKTFSKLSGLAIDDIKEYEKKGTKIPKSIEKIYFKTLSVKRLHVMQLRQVMSGRSDKVVDDRDIPKRIKISVWSRDKGKCTNCGSDNKLHYHHILHFAEGGQHMVDNLKLLCASCHSEEHKGEKSYYMLKKMAEE